jgi:peptidoglycan/LPS O-acetylase OafA/YrhL
MIRERPTPGPIKRFFMLGGDASYALYLSHPFVLSAVALCYTKTGFGHARLYVGAGFVASLGFSVLFYLKCEAPLQQLARRWPDRRSRDLRRAPVSTRGLQPLWPRANEPVPGQIAIER